MTFRPAHSIFSISLSILILLICFSCQNAYSPNKEVAAQLPEKIDFNFHIKPILSDRCFKCHGPDNNAREAELRLDQAETALKKTLSEGGRAFVPGKVHKSKAFQRMISADPELIMPPPDSKLSLSDYEIALIGKWIEQGAEYKEHWSFIPPEKSSLPKVRKKEWPRNEIDRFILARLEQKGWTPAKEANKETLLRRLSFDLTGLPPTIEEIDAFLQDNSPKAYEKVVDRLLASPAYGERMAVDWLDVARYADSHGYQDDGFRYVWPWRDWVIRALNKNMPYDQFIRWQLAGDLFPEATQEQRLATTFLRNHRMNSEAGIVGEEYRVEYVADRTNTLGAAILGLTLECARCHDHKYDPISQEDYYSLFAFFNNVNELGEIANEGNAGPLMMLSDKEVEAQIAWLEKQIQKQETKLTQYQVKQNKAPLPSNRQIEQGLRQGLIVHYPFDKISGQSTPNQANRQKAGRIRGEPLLVDGRFGKAVQLREYEQIFTGAATKFERTDAFSVSLWLKPVQENAYVPIWGDPSNKNQDFRGFGMVLDHQKVMVRLIHALPHNHIQVISADKIPLEQWSHVVVRYDGSSRAEGVEVFINGRAAELSVQYDRLYKGFSRTDIRLGGGAPWGSFDGGSIDELRIYDRLLSRLEIACLFDPGAGLGEKLSDQKSILQEYELIHHNKAYQKDLAQLDSLRRAVHETQDTVQEIMVMEEMEQPRPTFVLNRGVYDSPGEQVWPGTPTNLGKLSDDLPDDRRGLASWLLAPRHPLTARVAVNRFWKQFFGRGLVHTPADFGNQGALPSHPKLLDWLAVHFIESGWDIKKLLKYIVLSSTYRQDSSAPDSLIRLDPDNIWMARGARFRLPAEMLRDNALAASGLLVDKTGGPPVKPYQPPGLWKELAAIKNSLSEYQQDHGDNLYRRSLYTFWKRSSPPPSLSAFDAPDRELCEVQRQQTSTPLQALVLWNDPQWLEAARLIGERMIREGGKEEEERIVFAFRLLTSRRPASFELKRLRQFYQSQLQKYRLDPAAARNLLVIGEYPVKLEAEAAELAACAMTAHTILNLHEAIVRY